jgi:hypothetical protein
LNTKYNIQNLFLAVNHFISIDVFGRETSPGAGAVVTLHVTKQGGVKEVLRGETTV